MDHCLLNKTIENVFIASDRLALQFLLSDKTEIIAADADCCSCTWIEHIQLPPLGFPARVMSVKDIIQTDKGDMFIEYRNSSNGYYGGNLCWPGDSYFGGVHQQNISNEDWILISEV